MSVKTEPSIEFEDWLQRVHLLSSEWDNARGCYKDFPAHLAYQAWQAARASQVAAPPQQRDESKEPK